MIENIKIVRNRIKKSDGELLGKFGVDNALKVYQYHKSFPGYSMTPLEKLDGLSEYLGVDKIYIKDESHRFGLNAFKGLGGSYCIGRYIAEQLQMDINDFTYDIAISNETKNQLGDITFVTATDGNHGRGIAWTASLLGYKSVVYLPKGSAIERLDNIKALGAEASITDLNYDDTVRFANKMAEDKGWVLIQDTAWENYEKIPTWIMKGYTTMGLEIANELKDKEVTHVFLQAGVGAMAGAMTGFLADYYKDKTKPIITILEPNKADCIYKTAEAGDGSLHMVKGDLDTIMAGLACGEPCSIGWEVLNAYADYFISLPDTISAKGMRVLANPIGNDNRVISGESGAVGVGFIYELMQNHKLSGLKEKLQIDENSKLLFISTEGDTDQENYRKIVWDGLYSSV